MHSLQLLLKDIGQASGFKLGSMAVLAIEHRLLCLLKVAAHPQIRNAKPGSIR
jgi:hypothetical protein